LQFSWVFVGFLGFFLRLFAYLVAIYSRSLKHDLHMRACSFALEPVWSLFLISLDSSRTEHIMAIGAWPRTGGQGVEVAGAWGSEQGKKRRYFLV
jgi:hypothetical protein